MSLPGGSLNLRRGEERSLTEQTLPSRTSRQSVTPRLEAERLIGLAKAMLTDPSNEMACIYLDHAVVELRRLLEQELSQGAEAPAMDRG